MTRSNQRGFTLIELVVVITILGILAAFAVPRFLSLDTQARVAAVQGLAGSIRSAATLARGMSLVNAGSVTMDGTAIAMVNGYPAATAAGIQAALQDTTGFTISGAGPLVFTKTGAAGATPANCSVTYTAAGVGGSATVTVGASLATDC